MSSRPLLRVVIDTNLIIAARYRQRSASSRIIDLCLERKIQAVYSGRTKDENLFILQKVRPPAEYLGKIVNFYAKAIYIPEPSTRVTIVSDKSDNRYFEAAIDGSAQYIISNDHHLLEHNGYHGIKVLRPREFLKEYEEWEQGREGESTMSDDFIID